MKKRFSEEQIIGVLKEGEAGLKPAELCRKYGISEATYYIYGLLPIANGIGQTRKSIAYIYPASGQSPAPNWNSARAGLNNWKTSGAVIEIRFPARRIDRSAIRQFVNASLVTLLHCFLIRLAGG